MTLPTLTFGLELAKLPHLPDAHIGIANNIFGFSVCKLVILNVTRNLNSFMNGFGGFAQAVSAKLLIIYSWNRDVNVDSIEQGAGDALLISGNDTRSTPIGLLCIPEVPAWAGLRTIGQGSILIQKEEDGYEGIFQTPLFLIRYKLILFICNLLCGI
jgi:hypothetical protein